MKTIVLNHQLQLDQEVCKGINKYLRYYIMML